MNLAFVILQRLKTLFYFFYLKDYVILFCKTYYNDLRSKCHFSYSYIYMVMWDNYRFYFDICEVKLNFKEKFQFSIFYFTYDAIMYSKGLSKASSRTKASVTPLGYSPVVKTLYQSMSLNNIRDDVS